MISNIDDIGRGYPKLFTCKQQSGGIGLTMDEIEAIYGAGQPGQTYMVYTDPMFGVDLHIGHENQVADYVWLVLGDEQAFEGFHRLRCASAKASFMRSIVVAASAVPRNQVGPRFIEAGTVSMYSSTTLGESDHQRDHQARAPADQRSASSAGSEPSDSRFSTILLLEVTAELGRGSGSSSDTGTP